MKRVSGRVERLEDRIGRRQRDLMFRFLGRLGDEIRAENPCPQCVGRLLRAIERLEGDLRGLGMDALKRVRAAMGLRPLAHLSDAELEAILAAGRDDLTPDPGSAAFLPPSKSLPS